MVDSAVLSKRSISTDQVWQWLENVPDPEIPVLSVVDLGIVRAIDWEGDTLVIALTPTYSGCPAITAIALDVEVAMLRMGVEKVRIETRLSPAWTTDWIGPEAREKMRTYGIAPPVPGMACIGEIATIGKKGQVVCPHCGSHATEEVSRFGSTPCKAAWRCKDCLEPFDYFKQI